MQEAAKTYTARGFYCLPSVRQMPPLMPKPNFGTTFLKHQQHVKVFQEKILHFLPWVWNTGKTQEKMPEHLGGGRCVSMFFYFP